MDLERSSFSRNIIRLNRLNERGFDKWVFYPEMLFGSDESWWTDKKRSTPHEGIDICLFRDKHGSIKKLRTNTFVPLISSGMIVKIEDDFLGQSVYVMHKDEDNKKILHTIYGHVKPIHGIKTGARFCEGDVIATLAGTKNRKTPPHLHISFAWISKTFPVKRLSWAIMKGSKEIVLADPLKFITLRCEIP